MTLLEDPCTLRFDGLNLGDTIPHDAILPEGFVDLFQRTLATALQQKPSTTHDKGLYLSFERSKHLDLHLVQAIERALLHATRPVRGLSLEDVTPLDGDAWVRLIRLLNTPLPTATSDFELSLTSFNYDQEAYSEVQESLFRSLTEMVSESIPSLYAAGMSGVTARLHKEEIYQDESLAVPMRDVQVSITEYCDVVCVSPNGHFQLHVSDRNAQDRRFTGWAESKSIAGVRIGNRDIVGLSCTRLIVDMDEERPSYCDFLVNNVLGANLTHLSLRHCHHTLDYLPFYLERCPHLVELSAEDCGPTFDVSKWHYVPPNTGALLQALNITSCYINEKTLSTLPALPSFRYLPLAHNALNAKALEQVFIRLQSNPSHLHINVNQHQDLKPSTEHEYALVKAQFQQYLQYECISVATRITFLSVVFHIETTGCLMQCLPRETTILIFGMVGTRADCTLIW